MVWIQLAVCLAVIVIAGGKLAKYGDLLAEKTGLGRAWIGAVLIAAITSIPELATGISSVTLIGDIDLTMGDLLGSNLANLVIIAVIDLLYAGGPVLSYAGKSIALTAALGSVLIGTVAAAIYLSHNGFVIPVFGRIGIYSIIVFLLYLMAQYIIFRYKPDAGDHADEGRLAPPVNQGSLKRVIIYFAAAALTTAAAGTWLAFIGEQIVELTGLASGFVGTSFLAIWTSAPEIVVSVSAVRLGAANMAVGNMVGSNLFNMGVIIFVNDLFYHTGSIFAGVDISHLVPAMFALIMSGVVIAGVLFRPRVRLPVPMGIDSLALVVLYLAGMATLYLLS